MLSKLWQAFFQCLTITFFRSLDNYSPQVSKCYYLRHEALIVLKEIASQFLKSLRMLNKDPHLFHSQVSTNDEQIGYVHLPI